MTKTNEEKNCQDMKGSLEETKPFDRFANLIQIAQEELKIDRANIGDKAFCQEQISFKNNPDQYGNQLVALRGGKDVCKNKKMRTNFSSLQQEIKNKDTSFDKIWQVRFNELVKFKEQNGHCHVPQRYSPNQALGAWVHKQRQDFRKMDSGKVSSLNPFRIQALDSIGFQATASNRAEALWQKRYNELLAYKRRYGNCHVPQVYLPNKALGKWVHRQRHELKKAHEKKDSFLTPDRIEALKSIDFRCCIKKRRKTL